MLVPPTNINKEGSFATNYTIVDVLVVCTWTLDYTHNNVYILKKYLQTFTTFTDLLEPPHISCNLHRDSMIHSA